MSKHVVLGGRVPGVELWWALREFGEVALLLAERGSLGAKLSSEHVTVCDGPSVASVVLRALSQRDPSIRVHLASEEILRTLLTTESWPLPEKNGTLHRQLEFARRFSRKRELYQMQTGKDMEHAWGVLSEGTPPSSSFPIMVKSDFDFGEEEPSHVGKGVIVYDKGALKELLASLAVQTHNYVWQTAAPGDAKQYSYGGIYSRGQELASICVEQLIQHPRGISAYVREAEPELADVVRNRVAELFSCSDVKPEGFVEVEFVCSDSSRMWAIDCNCRVWGWWSILKKAYGTNLHSVLTKRSTNQPAQRVQTDKLSWLNEPRLLAAIGKNRSPKTAGLLLRAFRDPRCHKVFEGRYKELLWILCRRAVG